MAVERVERVYGGNSLVDILDRILDKGLVIDVWARVSLVGIELLTVEARVVVASVDTYLRYAREIGNTPLVARPPREQGLLDGPNGGVLQNVTGAAGGAAGQITGSQGGQNGQNGQSGQDGQANGLPAVADQLRAILEQLQGSQSGQGR